MHDNLLAIVPKVGAIEAKCSEIRNNGAGVDIKEYGRFRTNSGARNYIHNNDIGFYSDGGILFLINGENLIQENMYNFGGVTLSSGMMSPQSLSHSLSATYDFYNFNVNRNDIDPLYQPYVINDILYGSYQQLGALDLKTRTFSVTPTGISVSTDPLDLTDAYPITYTPFAYSPCPTNGIVVTPYSHIDDLSPNSDPTNIIVNNMYFVNTELKDAIREAASHMTIDLDYPNQDSLAVSKLASILVSPTVLYTIENLELVNIVQNLMSQAVSMSISLGHMQAGELLPLNTHIEQLITSVYDYIEAVNTPENEKLISFKLLEVLNLYRVSGHYDECIQILNNDSRLLSLPDGVYDFWDCLINNEFQLLNGEIDLEGFLNANAICNSLMSFRKERPNVEKALAELGAKKNAVSSLLAYPNPTNDNVELRFILPSKQITEVKVYTLTGLHIESIKSSDPRNYLQLDLRSVASGMYILEVYDQFYNKERVRVIKQ